MPIQRRNAKRIITPLPIHTAPFSLVIIIAYGGKKPSPKHLLQQPAALKDEPQDAHGQGQAGRKELEAKGHLAFAPVQPVIKQRAGRF